MKTDTPLTDAEVKLVGMLGEHLVGVGLCRRMERENAALRKALKPLADIARLMELYNGEPCRNPLQFTDRTIVCHQHYGTTEVKITLGQCRAVEKLLS